MTVPPPRERTAREQRRAGSGPFRPRAVTSAPPLEERGQPALYRIGKRVLGYAVLAFFAALFIAPFALALANSFKTRPETLADPLSLIPGEPTLRAYEIMARTDIPRWALNSVFVTVMVTVARLFLDSLAGYALARLRFPGRAVIFALVVAVLAVPPIVLAIPRYLVLGQLGMLDTYSGLILPLAVDAFGIFLMKTFFESIPREMEEAARIDGASIFQTYLRIILPLAAPGLIALTILSFQASWNEFLHPLIAAPSDPDLRTLPVGLALLRGAQGESQDFPLLLGASLLITLPVALIFFVFQRYFIQGVAASAVKG
ncbi:carbohydrate ABC transporter permease [Phytoactinopolyspora alkaliphila]|uniref:Carbohydrate ABC transporter permease n=1 Tax=Phytoactinopolyspora alkaliphila TaxID=1783498 RepID=A0A6N9YH82_9ACTN|nr:carbohydrate ABC transporter permease [Phytoactinopolyspora alkaliphila]NED94287.1 carbohydrate ABC transporter permease [Phytoactinopolyspora alkaliphila]